VWRGIGFYTPPSFYRKKTASRRQREVFGEVKKNSIRFTAALISLILAVACVFLGLYLDQQAALVTDTGIVTGGRNRAITADETSGIIYVATHDGMLQAFKDGELLWSAEKVPGSYCRLYLSQDKAKLYAANEGQKVYIFDTADGKPLLEIPVGRNVVDIAINSDESLIAVATNTGRNKANVLIYTKEGELLNNNALSNTVLRGIEYGKGDLLIIANKRGEVTHMTSEGETIQTYKANYDVVKTLMQGETCWVLTIDGTYHALDADLNVIRKGRVINDINAYIQSIGVDKNGEYVFIGTEQGYVFVLNADNQQVYVENFSSQITDTFAMDDVIYFTGLNDFVKIFHPDRVENYKLLSSVKTIANIAAGVLVCAFIVLFILAVPKLKRKVGLVLKAIRKHKMAYILLLPTFVILFLFSYRGIFIGLTRAFTNWSSRNYYLADIEFVWFDNFKAIIENGYFLIGIKNLALIIVTSIIKTLTVPLAVAWMIWAMTGNKRKYIHRFLVVLPIVIPGVVNIMVWERIYDPTVGLINNLLRLMNLEHLQRVWLGDSGIAMWAVIFVGFPFVMALPMLVYYGALSNIGSDVVESASIDGAGRWRTFWLIQLPLLRPQIGLLITLTFIGSMQDFYTIYLLTSGGPGTSTYVPALELFLNVSNFGNYGYASAMGIVLMICTLVPVLLGQVISKRREGLE